MSAPVRPTTSAPSSNLQPTLVLGDNLEGHRVGDTAFYFNGILGVLQNGPTPGSLYFVPVESGPPVPPSQIFVPPDIETAWRSLMWALGSGLPNGINAAKASARAIGKVR